MTHDASLRDLARDGKNINVLTCGNQTSRLGVICVHGWACQGADYARIFECWSENKIDFYAMAPDLPGHGNMPMETWPKPTIAGFATFIRDLAYVSNFTNVVLVGHSMGVRVILDAYHQAQSTSLTAKIVGLVFLDGSHYKLRASLFAFDSSDPRSALLSSEEKAARKAEAFNKMFSSHTPADFQRSTQEHVKAMDENYSNELRKSQLDFDYNHMDDRMAEAGRSAMPLLSFQSSDIDDRNQRMKLEPGKVSKFMRYVQEMVPQAEHVVIEDSGHFPHVDYPDKVAERMREFIEKCMPSR